MNENMELIFKQMPPLDEPGCNWPGLMQERIVYPKGYVTQEGRRPLPCEILCDSDREFVIGKKKLTIYADIYRPNTEEKVPAIICWGYAGKRDTNNKIETIKMPDGKGGMCTMISKDRLSGLQAWESLDPAQWVQYGYAVVNADPPGANYSEGNMLLFGSEDCENGCDFIEQIAKEDWCTGKVAMAGSSWYAMVQLFFASHKPPHLTCIAPFEAEEDLYRDEYVRGGVGLTGESFSIGFRTHGRNQIEDIGAMIQKYPLMNEYWEDKIIHAENIEIPAFIVGSYTSWYHTRGTPRHYNNLASKEKWYRTHVTTEWIDLYSDYYQNDLKKFFDYYLKGIENDWKETPPVRLSLFNPGGKNIENRPETAYPPADMVPTVYAIDFGNKTMQKEAVDVESTLTYDYEKEHSVYVDLTFDEDVEIAGPSKLRLWLSAMDTDDMDVFCRFYKVDTNGKAILCDNGWEGYYGPEGRLRASHRELDLEKSTILEPYQKHTNIQKLQNGEEVVLDIQIWPTGMIFKKGETLRLEITGYDFVQDRPKNMIQVTTLNRGRYHFLSGGKYDTELVLPICKSK